MDITQYIAACAARVNRAHQLGIQLQDAISQYFSVPGRIELTGSYDASKNEYVFRAWLAEPLPLEWMLVLSDMIHQARTACDNIVYTLILHRGVVPSNRSSFPPILSTKSEYDGWKTPRKGRSPLDGLTQMDIDLIERFQPWHPNTTSTSRYLRLLQELSNQDKHRLVHIIQVFVTSWGNRTTGEKVISGFPLFPRDDGKLGFISALDLPVEQLFPPNDDISIIHNPTYLNDPLTTSPTDVVRIPTIATGPNPELQFFLPRLRILYTDRGFDEFSVTPTILWACEAATEVINTLKPQFSI
jgi:hypothetical protein